MLLVPPEHRRESAGRRRRRVPGEHLEERAGRATGREAREPDRAAGAADAEQLAGDRLVIRCEHRPEARRDGVEIGIGERQRLGVRLDPAELDAAPGRLVASGDEVLRRQVGATTSAPRSAARIATLPVPAATSRTRCPAVIRTRRRAPGRPPRRARARSGGSRRAPTSPAPSPSDPDVAVRVIVPSSPGSALVPEARRVGRGGIARDRPFRRVRRGMWTSPWRTAYAAAAARLGRSSLRRMFVTWRWTVCSLTTSRSAIWRFVRPPRSGRGPRARAA